MIPVALALSLLAGVSLGLLGGGGSVLTVPILVYVAGVPAQARHHDVAGRGGHGQRPSGRSSTRGSGSCGSGPRSLFGCAGIVGALPGARLTQRVSERWLLTLFAILMLIVAVSMARTRREPVALDWVEPRLAAMVAVGWGSAS